MALRKRIGMLALFGGALLLAVVEPATAQSTSSTVSEEAIWGLNTKLIYAAVPITVLVEGILIYTVWKYRKADEAKPTQENRRLEITWTIATAIILLFVGVASYQVLGNPYVSASSNANVTAQENVEDIYVYGQKYNWNFQYHGIEAEGVSGTGLTMENVTISDANVTNTTAEGIEVRNAEISGPELESATLVNGTIVGTENRTGNSVTFEDVTVESAAIEDATISNGSATVANTMVMPKGQEVAINITSRDWLHAFHAPSMGLKQDAFPGEWNELRTRATATGNHQLYCAEYCGSGHSAMLGQINVVSQDEYQQWQVEQWLAAQA